MPVGALRHGIQRGNVVEFFEDGVNIREILLERDVVFVGIERVGISTSEQDHRRSHQRTLKDARRNLTHGNFVVTLLDEGPKLFVARCPTAVGLGHFLVGGRDRAVEIEDVRSRSPSPASRGTCR